MNFWTKNTSRIKEPVIDIAMIVFAFLSFIPQISIISIAFFSVTLLFLKRKLKASLIFFNIAIFTSLVYYIYLKPKTEEFHQEVYRIGFHSNWEKAAIKKINYCNKKLVEYKNKNDVLPDSLFDIQNGFMDFEDVSYVDRLEGDGTLKLAKIYYEKIDSNKYYLLGSGPDGIPKTKDDILPEILIKDTATTGLIRYKVIMDKELDKRE